MSNPAVRVTARDKRVETLEADVKQLRETTVMALS
jgi:hypothetical protein